MQPHLAPLLVAASLAACQATPPTAPLARVADPTLPVAPNAGAPSELDSARPPAPARAVDETEAYSYELPAPTPADGEDEWRFVVAPYIWMLSLDGNSEVDGTVTKIDEDFFDLLDQLNFVFEGRAEAWKGKSGAMIDLSYMQLDNDADVGPLSADIDTDVTIAFAGYMHNLLDRPADENGVGMLRVDGFIGVAYTSVDVDVDIDGASDLSGDESWVDPLLGLRSRWSFTEKWNASLRFDFGGFEIFDGSELFTLTTALAGRKFGDNKTLYFGWRSMFIDYSHDLELDLVANGPVVGFQWDF